MDAKNDAAGEADRAFVISRVFDAPRDLVWKAWTEVDRLAQWFGPKGCKITAAKMDLRPGGFFHFGMRTADGGHIWGKWAFQEIVVPEKLIWIHSFSDEKGGVTRHPMQPNWPLTLLTTTTFAEQVGKTKITLHWIPINASAAERQAFDAGRQSINMGWTGTFDQFADYLATQEKAGRSQ